MDFVPRDGEELIELASAHLAARTLHASVRSGLFEALAARPRTADELAGDLGTKPGATRLLADALVGLGLLAGGPDGYRLTATGRRLTPGAPEPLAAITGYWAWSWEIAGRIEELLRDGRPVQATAMFEGDPAAKERFIRAMHDTARAGAPLVAAQFELAGPSRLIDLGAGPGTYSLALLERFPALVATLFDLPGTLEVTRRIAGESGLAARIELASGDFLVDPLGGPYDAALASHVLHGIDEAQVPRLLERIAAALVPGGQLVLQDFFLEAARARPAYASLFGLYMRLQNPGARCYAFDELADWLEAAGFFRLRWVRGRQPRGLSLVRAVRR